VESGRGLGHGWCLWFRGGKLLSCRRNRGHGIQREHASSLQLPVLVLLQQHRTDKPGDGCVIGKDADDTGAALDFLVHALQQVGAPQLAPVLLREVAEGQHVLPG